MKKKQTPQVKYNHYNVHVAVYRGNFANTYSYMNENKNKKNYNKFGLLVFRMPANNFDNLTDVSSVQVNEMKIGSNLTMS